MKRTAIWNCIFAALLALGTASFVLADDGGSDTSHGHDSSSATGSGSGQAQPGDDKGGQAAQPGDDKGSHVEPGDDHGNNVEPGDDRGNHVEPGDDKGGTSNNNDGSQDFRVRRRLMPVPGSPAIDAGGHAVIRAQGSRQRFQVEVEAMVPDGTTFMVFADDNLAGTVTLQMGEGELELDTEDADLPDGLNPVTAIRSVTVKDANGVPILQARI